MMIADDQVCLLVEASVPILISMIILLSDGNSNDWFIDYLMIMVDDDLDWWLLIIMDDEDWLMIMLNWFMVIAWEPCSWMMINFDDWLLPIIMGYDDHYWLSLLALFIIINGLL